MDMKQLHFEITIQATQEGVWDAIVNDEKYRVWASEFYPGSYFEGGWNEGDSIRFLALDEQGEKGGMVSEIAKSSYPAYISIRHIGIISRGKEDTTSDEVKKWTPSYENYTLQQVDGQATNFLVDMDAVEEWAPMFEEMWPRALRKLKALCEA